MAIRTLEEATKAKKAKLNVVTKGATVEKKRPAADPIIGVKRPKVKVVEPVITKMTKAGRLALQEEAAAAAAKASKKKRPASVAKDVEPIATTKMTKAARLALQEAEFEAAEKAERKAANLNKIHARKQAKLDAEQGVTSKRPKAKEVVSEKPASVKTGGAGSVVDREAFKALRVENRELLKELAAANRKIAKFSQFLDKGIIMMES